MKQHLAFFGILGTAMILATAPGAAGDAGSCAGTAAAGCPMSKTVAMKSMDCDEGLCEETGADFAVFIKKDGTLYLNSWKTSREKLSAALSAPADAETGEKVATVALEVDEGAESSVIAEIQKLIADAGAQVLQPATADGKLAATSTEVQG